MCEDSFGCYVEGEGVVIGIQLLFVLILIII